jgi:hypothetical protein
LIGVAVPVLVVAMDTQARACTAVFVSAGGAVLVGNNEDASMPLSKVWVVPGEGGKYSRLCLGYASDNTIQGGVNEKGLWFDSFSVEAKPIAASTTWEPDHRGTFVTFHRDQAGKVTGFVADTTSWRISATRVK